MHTGMDRCDKLRVGELRSGYCRGACLFYDWRIQRQWQIRFVHYYHYTFLCPESLRCGILMTVALFSQMGTMRHNQNWFSLGQGADKRPHPGMSDDTVARTSISLKDSGLRNSVQVKFLGL